VYGLVFRMKSDGFGGSVDDRRVLKVDDREIK